MKNPWILPATALAVGAIGGFISGKNNGESSAAASAAQAAQNTRASNRPAAGMDAESKRASKAGNLEDIMKKPGSSSRIQAMLDFYSSLSADQLAEEAKKLENLPMGERMSASLLLFGRWAEVDPMAAMTFSNSMGFAGAFVRPTILQSWASTDPANAAKYYSENPGQFATMNMGMGRGQNASSIIAGEWARQDPEAALAWANSLTQNKGQALSSVIGEVAKTDPAKAAEMLAKMDPAERADSYTTLANQWGAKNFDDAQTWINTLPAEERARAMAEAVQGLATTNPELAASKISSLEPGRDTERTIADTARNWAREDPAATAAWLKTLEPGRGQTQAMEPLISSWVAKDPAAALAYVNSQSAGDVRDSAVSSYVNANVSADPSTLTSMAESIGDERDRGRTVAQLYNRWKQTDSAAADAYLKTTTAIPDNMKERMTQGGGRGNWGGGGRPGGGGGGGR